MRYISIAGGILEKTGASTRMIFLEGVKLQYAVILPGVHAEAIITHPFNVSHGAWAEIATCIFVSLLPPPSSLSTRPPSSTFSRTISRIASSRPSCITLDCCETMYARYTNSIRAERVLSIQLIPPSTFTIIIIKVQPSHFQIVYDILW